MKKENDFSELYETVKKLRKENIQLNGDNEELAKKLNSKRYKVVDFLVDSSYRIIKKKTKKSELIGRNINSKKKMGKNEECDGCLPKSKRRVDKGRVDLVNMNFYDWDGNVVYRGGPKGTFMI